MPLISAWLDVLIPLHDISCNRIIVSLRFIKYICNPRDFFSFRSISFPFPHLWPLINSCGTESRLEHKTFYFCQEWVQYCKTYRAISSFSTLPWVTVKHFCHVYTSEILKVLLRYSQQPSWRSLFIRSSHCPLHASSPRPLIFFTFGPS